jgi:hypothetical protein
MPKRGKRPFYYAAPVVSSNWRYLTDIDGAGPRKDEIMLTTTDAKKSFALETSDIARIEGFRRPGARSTLTLYYHGDLVALSVKKHGQEHFDAKIPEGRKLSGADAREQALRTAAGRPGRGCAQPLLGRASGASVQLADLSAAGDGHPLRGRQGAAALLLQADGGRAADRGGLL